MSIVIKTIGKNKYAYSAHRAGKKVVQRYLGPLDDPQIAAAVQRLRAERYLPPCFHYLFWDAAPAAIDLRANARYIIERVLECGGAAELKWLQELYPVRRIMDTCATSRKLSAKSKNFWEVWFDAP